MQQSLHVFEQPVAQPWINFMQQIKNLNKALEICNGNIFFRLKGFFQ